MSNQSVVITGASSGIGLGASEVMVARGWRVFGSVRKAEDGERLKTELGENFTPVEFDVTDEAAVERGAAEVRKALDGKKLGGLVNNAGIAVGGPLLSMPLDDFRKQLEVNLTGVVACVKAFGPLLGVDRSLAGEPGRIVNVGSVGGTNAFPLMAPYHVSKFGLEGLTDSMRRELMPFGVDASLVAAGNVATPIWSKADREKYGSDVRPEYVEPIDAMFEQFEKMAEKGLTPEYIGERICEQLTKKRPAARVLATPAPLTYLAMKYLPKRMVDGIVAKRLGLTKSA